MNHMKNALCALLVCLSGITTAQADPPSDNFVALPNVEQMQSQAVVSGNTAILVNRGCIASEKSNEYERGCELRGTVTFNEGSGTYADVLTIVLHSSGQRQNEWPGEVSDGLAIVIGSNGGYIYTSIRTPGAEPQYLSRKTDFTISKGRRYNFKIVDNGNAVDVYFGDMKTPATIVKPDRSSFTGHRIVIYNREPVAGVRKSLVLSRLHLHALPE